MRRKSQRAGTKSKKSKTPMQTIRRWIRGKSSSSPFIDLEKGPSPRSSPKRKSSKKSSSPDLEKGEPHKRGAIEIVIHK